MIRSRKPDKSLKQLTVGKLKLSSDEPKVTNQPEPSPVNSLVSEYLSHIGRTGGLKGGRARAESLSAKRRSEIARKAAKARWKKTK
jgi:hypothetical protein